MSRRPRPPRPAPHAVDGVLLLYHHYAVDNAPTIREHIAAIEHGSRLPVFAVNTDLGYPRHLHRFRFRAIVLHYSLFGGHLYLLNDGFLRYLADNRSTYTVAFFQDEMRWCRKRFAFLDDFQVDCVYTLLEPEWVPAVYGKHTSVPTVVPTLTGYVSDELVAIADELRVPLDERVRDVGYRGRPLPFWMGRGAQEKTQIADEFARRSAGLGLRVDVATGEEDRIYGRGWYEFVAGCRAMLGVEAGTSIFDLDDSCRERTEALLAAEPDLDFEAVSERVLSEYEGNVFYRTVSPRHFEAAAFRVVQILYRGHYSGVMEPDVHYFALEKDWSNFDDVVARLRDDGACRAVTERAYDDLIASGRYTYQRFVDELDDRLERDAGVGRLVLRGEQRAIVAGLQPRIERSVRIRWRAAYARVRYAPFPGRRQLRGAYRAGRRALGLSVWDGD